MEGWAKVQTHRAEEITILCDQHHKERTNGLLPIEDVRKADREPFNLRKGVTKPYDLHFTGKHAEIVIGSNSFTMYNPGSSTVLAPVIVDGIALIAFVLEDGHLLLNVLLFDEYNNLVLKIANNQLVHSIEPWDIQLVGKRLVIREAHRKLLIEVEFQPPDRVVINRGRLLCNGVEILVRPNNLLIVNNSMIFAGNKAINVPAGFIIGRSPGMNCIMAIAKLPRYLGDRAEALKFEKETFL